MTMADSWLRRPKVSLAAAAAAAEQMGSQQQRCRPTEIDSAVFAPSGVCFLTTNLPEDQLVAAQQSMM
jgi:hypothetical protein